MAIDALIIAGATATGKTDLAIKLSEQAAIDIISVDARQLYKGLSILSGQDVPPQAKKTSVTIQGREWPIFKLSSGANLYGYDVFEPHERVGSGVYARMIQPVLMRIHELGRLPVLVGGSGFYLQAIMNPPDSIQVMPDYALREELKSASVVQLHKLLIKESPDRLNSMNQSDRNNPRRLIRALEVSRSGFLSKEIQPFRNAKTIVLKKPISEIRKSIRLRIEQRLVDGVVSEVQELRRASKTLAPELVTTTGFELINRYLAGLISLNEMKDQWLSEEIDYAKRQITWFKGLESAHYLQAGKTMLIQEVDRILIT